MRAAQPTRQPPARRHAPAARPVGDTVRLTHERPSSLDPSTLREAYRVASDEPANPPLSAQNQNQNQTVGAPPAAPGPSEIDQKQQLERWRIVQELQTKIFEQHQEIPPAMARTWDRPPIPSGPLAPSIFDGNGRPRPEENPPYHTQGRALGGQMPETARRRLEEIGVSAEQTDRVREELNRNAIDPRTNVLEAMSRNRVLGIGESHIDPNPERDFLRQMLPALRKAGATHLAVEMPAQTQPLLDEFSRTGKIDRNRLPSGLRPDDYMDVLNQARLQGLKLVAVDPNQALGRGRDGAMAREIGRILDADPKNKVVFFVGQEHLDRDRGFAAAPLLAKMGHSIHTVASHSNEHFFDQLTDLTADSRSAFAVRTGSAPHLSRLYQSPILARGERPIDTSRWGDFDTLMFFPKEFPEN
ncbi:MAG: hypothetical protein HY319_03635 [Armatimonadetes bacterium]|nr:hypothetical protein [Armatimonadota bacterium]